MKTVMKINI